jgi:hypothetical protein
MIQLNKVIINGVYGDNYVTLFLFDCSSYTLPYSNIKKKCFYKQPIKKENNNLMPSTMLLNDIILKCSLIEFNFKVSVVVTSWNFMFIIF